MQKGKRVWKQIKQDKIISDFSARKMILAGKYCLDWKGQWALKGRKEKAIKFKDFVLKKIYTALEVGNSKKLYRNELG